MRQLTPETASKAANAALAACRSRGFQVGVAVVDRSGIVQVHSGPFRRPAYGRGGDQQGMDCRELSPGHNGPRPQQPAGAARGADPHFPRVTVMGGGVPIEAGGSLLGAIAVSGAPGGEADEACARAGLEAIREEIEF